ncbi:trigger factor [Vigna unguiculata]|uniref:peptidylprolyl isomerase n=1 Tax=Vigna unguiculata TaxID=3917 RepID=A0A4D6LIS5_VIGUN|nr:trigger factor [Vigna unguiculata]
MKMNMNMNTNMASKSNSTIFGVPSFTTCPFSTTRARTCCIHVLAIPNAKTRDTVSLSLSMFKRRSLGGFFSPIETTLGHLNAPISALNSGLEASITDSNELSAVLTNAKIVLDSQDENKIQLRVDLTGDQTQKVFDRIVTNLGRTAPPVPGFRMQKGDNPVRKCMQIPKDFLVQMLGEERVIKFAIQEILNSTMADYENMDEKDWKISTTQTAEQLKKSFTPGNDFGFNVTLEPEN